MRVISGVVGVLAVTIAVAPETAARSSSPLFEFRSSFWVNLHHYLHALGREAAPLLEQLPPTVTAAERDAWQSAVWSYHQRYGGVSLFDEELSALKAQLAAAPSAESLRGSAVRPEDATLLEAVAPIYRRHRWIEHDAANVRFVAAVQPMLARFGDELTRRIARSFDASWPGRPVRVDLVHAAQPDVRAYTTKNPTHVTIAAINSQHVGLLALETLVEEASHGWCHVVRGELEEASKALKAELPGDLPHAVLAYNAGEITRRVLDDAGIPGYQPYVEAENLFPAFRPALVAHWPAFLDGRISRKDALRRILSSVLPRGASSRIPTGRGLCPAGPFLRPAAPC